MLLECILPDTCFEFVLFNSIYHKEWKSKRAYVKTITHNGYTFIPIGKANTKPKNCSLWIEWRFGQGLSTLNALLRTYVKFEQFGAQTIFLRYANKYKQLSIWYHYNEFFFYRILHWIEQELRSKRPFQFLYRQLYNISWW